MNGYINAGYLLEEVICSPTSPVSIHQIVKICLRPSPKIPSTGMSKALLIRQS